MLIIRNGNSFAYSESLYVGATSLKKFLQYPQVFVENIIISVAYAEAVRPIHIANVKINFFISSPFI